MQWVSVSAIEYSHIESWYVCQNGLWYLDRKFAWDSICFYVFRHVCKFGYYLFSFPLKRKNHCNRRIGLHTAKAAVTTTLTMLTAAATPTTTKIALFYTNACMNCVLHIFRSLFHANMLVRRLMTVLSSLIRATAIHSDTKWAGKMGNLIREK